MWFSKAPFQQQAGPMFGELRRHLHEVRTFAHLQRAFGWHNSPCLDFEHLHRFEHIGDLNDRRLRDAEVLGGACCNGDPRVIVEIGTAHGQTTALLARNAPAATVHTVNIPSDEINEGGRLVTGAPSREEIGRCYRQMQCGNVRQILANTKTWEPDCGPIDVAFIDGCHDTEFVINDTLKLLPHCRPGSLLMWHDFNPDLAEVHPWIHDVVAAIDRLYAQGHLSGPLFHMQDSWIGLYRVTLNDHRRASDCSASC